MRDTDAAGTWLPPPLERRAPPARKASPSSNDQTAILTEPGEAPQEAPQAADDAVLARILELIHTRQQPGESAWRHRARADEIHELQRQLATAFGARRGWHFTSAWFTPVVLARRALSGAWDGGWPHQFADHPFYYRLNRRAAGMVAHLYNDPIRDGVLAWAAAQRLAVSFPPEGSWWYPGVTRLVLFTPIMPEVRR